MRTADRGKPAGASPPALQANSGIVSTLLPKPLFFLSGWEVAWSSRAHTPGKSWHALVAAVAGARMGWSPIPRVQSGTMLSAYFGGVTVSQGGVGWGHLATRINFYTAHQGVSLYSLGSVSGWGTREPSA